jgi:hypothetical protein
MRGDGLNDPSSAYLASERFAGRLGLSIQSGELKAEGSDLSKSTS